MLEIHDFEAVKSLMWLRSKKCPISFSERTDADLCFEEVHVILLLVSWFSVHYNLQFTWGNSVSNCVSDCVHQNSICMSLCIGGHLGKCAAACKKLI